MLLHSSFIQFFFHKSLLVQDANMTVFNKIKRLKKKMLFQTVLSLGKIFINAQPWWVTSKINLVVIFVRKTTASLFKFQIKP